MRRREFLELSAAGVLCSGLGTARTASVAGEIRGQVTADGKGLARVVVSDGLQCVRTGTDGTFALPRREGARFVAVSPPCGYQMKDWYRRIAPAASYGFSLEKASEGKEKCGCRFVQIADSEISEDNAYNRQWIDDVRQIAHAERCAFIVHTGDICYLAGMQAHAQLMNTENMGLPVLYCLGNHDCVAGDYGEQAFEGLFGPCRYSFNAGGIHFLVVPMTEGWDVKPSYDEDELADWIRADLAPIKPNQPVMAFSHMLFHAKNESEAGLVIGKERPLDLRSACNFRGFVYGHVHNTYTSGNGGVAFMASSNPNFGGIDHSPEIVRVFDVKPDGAFVSENHYGRNRQRTWQTSRSGAAWERKLPAPVLFCTPVVSSGRVFVGTTDDENRGTGMVVAFDARNGAVAWKRKVANSIKNRMVVAGGNVIVQDAGGSVYAFAANSGKSVWKMQLPYHFQVLASAVTASEDGRTAYVGYGSRLTAVDAATGAVKWRNSSWEREPVAGAPGIGEGKMVWAANWDGLECHDLETGARLWQADGKPWRFPGADPLITDGKAVVACYWNIGEVDLATGQVLRNKELKEVTALPSGPILAAGGHYLVGSLNGGLLSIDRNTLEIVWRGTADMSLLGVGAYRNKGRMVNTSPVLTDNSTVCAACADGIIHFWDLATGAEKRRIATGAPYLAGVAISDGRLFAADMAGMIRMFPI
ncbi:MAG: PQQ-binding-like beta-propeller repeat protein [Kiritimatiellae bacterium]|nr:PQQ-binding-like beta-propeller repeat protein [Kiritimatiellia bacterium]